MLRWVCLVLKLWSVGDSCAGVGSGQVRQVSYRTVISQTWGRLIRRSVSVAQLITCSDWCMQCLLTGQSAPHDVCYLPFNDFFRSRQLQRRPPSNKTNACCFLHTILFHLERSRSKITRYATLEASIMKPRYALHSVRLSVRPIRPRNSRMKDLDNSYFSYFPPWQTQLAWTLQFKNLTKLSTKFVTTS